MPTWVRNLTSIGQIVIVGMSIAAVVLLAIWRIIDGAAAITALFIIIGAGTAIHTVTSKVVERATDNGVDNSQESRRDSLR